MSWVDKIIAVEVLIALFAPVVFVPLYLTVRWYRSWEGIVIMAKQLLFAGIFLNAVLYFWVGEDYPGRDAYRLFLFTALPIAMWGMTVLLIRSRLQSWKAPADLPPSPETRPLADDHQLG